MHALLNRADRSREIQPGLAGRVVGMPLLDTVLPEDVPGVEAAANTGVPERIDGRLRDAVGALQRELTDRTEPEEAPAASSEDELARRVAAETGSISAEFAGLLLPIAAVLLVVWQAILTGYTTVAANQAAAEAARTVTVAPAASDAEVIAAARRGLFGHWSRGVEVTRTVDAVHVEIPVPMLLPGTSSPWRVTTSAGIVAEPEPTLGLSATTDGHPPAGGEVT
jgi:pilus assembly protein CpaE